MPGTSPGMRSSCWPSHLSPEDREPEYQQHQEDHDKDVRQQARDVGGDAGEAEQARDDRYRQEDQRPFKIVINLTSSSARAGLTFARGAGS